jgi:hypothetical protein
LAQHFPRRPLRAVRRWARFGKDFHPLSNAGKHSFDHRLTSGHLERLQWQFGAGA